LSVALFAVGIFTRETAILLPGLYILSTFILQWPALLSADKRRAVVPFAGYLIVIAAYLPLQMLHGDTAALARGGLSLRSLNIESVLIGLVQYIHGLLPGGAALAGLSLEALRVLAWLETAALLGVAYALWRSRLHMALFGLAWLFFTPLLFVFFNEPADRYFYLPSMGYAILIGSLLAEFGRWASSRQNGQGRQLARPVAAATTLAVMVIIALQLPGLWDRLQAWHAAGRTSGSVIAGTTGAVPDPEDYAAFFFIDLPPGINGVPAFGNGIQQAVQLAYDNRTIAAGAASCQDLQGIDLPRYSYFFKFVGDSVAPLASKEDCLP
jgi:hypothetical protein